MKLHNTLTKKTEELVPLDDGLVRIYSCGPTVYNHAHIGNLSSYIFADILRRAVKASGYKTKHVMNFTDVDDKTIRDSHVEYPDLAPMEALAKLTRHYEDIFIKEMRETGNDVTALTFMRATENIEKMQELIRGLLANGSAYTADDGIYFDIRKYASSNKHYGQLSKIELKLDRRARIDNDEYDKDSAQDFALWKVAKPGEPAWDFILDDNKNLRGRPGWHIECSAMSVDGIAIKGEQAGLGQPFDIHTGGVDLIFPHHENEIAQSTAGQSESLLAKIWCHNEHLLVDGTKMAKSKGNFYTLVDVKEHGFDPLAFRMLVLQSHYRSPSNFSWDNLTAAAARLRRWRNAAELRHQLADSGDDGQTEIVNNLLDQARSTLTDDLDTPMVLKYIDEAVNVLADDPSNLNQFALSNLIRWIDDNLGLAILNATPDVTEGVKELLATRAEARATRDFAASDKLRDQLLSLGIEVSDTATGQVWAHV